MKKFEYMQFLKSYRLTSKELNEFGDKGWELTIYDSGIGLYVFKREII